MGTDDCNITDIHSQVIECTVILVRNPEFRAIEKTRSRRLGNEKLQIAS